MHGILLCLSLTSIPVGLYTVHCPTLLLPYSPTSHLVLLYLHVCISTYCTGTVYRNLHCKFVRTTLYVAGHNLKHYVQTSVPSLLMV